MKYLYSVIAVVVLTVVLATLKPPTPTAVAESSHVEALQQPVNNETPNIPSTAETAQVAAETQPSEPIKAEPAPAPLGEREQMMQQVGIPEGDWPAVQDILNKESGWCHTKWEGEYGACPAYHGAPTSGGYGLCQSTPPQKMATMGDDWATNPVTQLKWCHQYMQGYGGWQPAKTFRDCVGWCYSPRTKTNVFKKTTWI